MWNKDFEDLPSKVKFLKVYKVIQEISGWTDDRQWWAKVSQEIERFLKEDKQYYQEVKSWKRRPVVLQIADTDVTENWVKYVKSMLKRLGLEPEAISFKRLILWKYKERIFKSNEWWDKEVDWKLIKRQEFVWRKDEIVEKIKELFRNFIIEYKWDKKFKN